MAELIKVAIVGPESSGKTFLAEKLALHFDCLWVREYAREYLKPGCDYTQHDVEQIARGQIKSEDSLTERSNSVLICDTNLLVIKIWMEHKYGSTSKRIEEEISRRKYHLHLLTAPDLPYEDDPLRENPELGEYFFEKYKQLLVRLKMSYQIVSGNEQDRIFKAIRFVQNEINKTDSMNG